MTQKTRLPIKESDFDALAAKLYNGLRGGGISAAVSSLTDDELLVWAEVDDALVADPAAAAARDRTRVWIPIREAVDAEMATR